MLLRGTLFLAVLLLSAAAPAALSAETLAFRNDTNAALVIQGACVIRGQLRHDQPIMVLPGNVARVNLPGNKLITVYHARMPNRPLFQGTVPGGNEDLYFSVQFDNASGKARLEQIKPPVASSSP